MDRNDLIRGEGHPAGRAPAPGDLRLVQDLVNTVDRENGVELLDGRAGAAAWLAHRGLPGAGRCGPVGLAHLVELREALRTLLLRSGDLDGARAALEAAATRARLHPAFVAGGPVLVPGAAGVDAAIGHVVAVAYAAMLDGRWGRLKACPREVCGWAFHDRSSNNGSTWCSMAVCGNRVKAAAYYRRRVAAARS